MEKAVQAYRERYRDFGPTFATEKLSEIEGIPMSVSVEAVPHSKWGLEGVATKQAVPQ
jgi:hypothetical protein